MSVSDRFWLDSDRHRPTRGTPLRASSMEKCPQTRRYPDHRPIVNRKTNKQSGLPDITNLQTQIRSGPSRQTTKTPRLTHDLSVPPARGRGVGRLALDRPHVGIRPRRRQDAHLKKAVWHQKGVKSPTSRVPTQATSHPPFIFFARIPHSRARKQESANNASSSAVPPRCVPSWWQRRAASAASPAWRVQCLPQLQQAIAQCPCGLGGVR